MAVDPNEFARRTRLHYRDSFERHGPTPQGVDWNGEASQRRQFDELMRILPAAGPFSVNDFGCGYGALADVLLARGQESPRCPRWRPRARRVQAQDQQTLRRATA
jgi:hypothetical protein